MIFLTPLYSVFNITERAKKTAEESWDEERAQFCKGEKKATSRVSPWGATPKRNECAAIKTGCDRKADRKSSLQHLRVFFMHQQTEKIKFN
jgi:hypothetical protein